MRSLLESLSLVSLNGSRGRSVDDELVLTNDDGGTGESWFVVATVDKGAVAVGLVASFCIVTFG